MSATNSLLSANLRSHGRRYISTGLAVAISTAFIVITLIVMTAMTAGLTSGVYSQYRGGTIVVSQNADATGESIQRAEEILRSTSGVTAIKHMAQWPADAQTDATRGRLYVSPLAPKPFAGLDPLTEGRRHRPRARRVHRGCLPDSHHRRHHTLEHDQHGRARQLRD